MRTVLLRLTSMPLPPHGPISESRIVTLCELYTRMHGPVVDVMCRFCITTSVWLLMLMGPDAVSGTSGAPGIVWEAAGTAVDGEGSAAMPAGVTTAGVSGGGQDAAVGAALVWAGAGAEH